MLALVCTAPLCLKSNDGCWFLQLVAIRSELVDNLVVHLGKWESQYLVHLLGTVVDVRIDQSRCSWFHDRRWHGTSKCYAGWKRIRAEGNAKGGAIGSR